MSRSRTVVASSSIGVIALVVVVAMAVGPRELRVWLAVFAVLSVAMAVAAAVAEPRDLTPAVLSALAPVIALVSEGSPTWLMAPFAALLLVAAELNALSWASEGPGAEGRPRSHHLTHIGQLAALGLAASWAVAVAAEARWLGGTAAVLCAAGALAGIGYVVSRRDR